MAPTTNLGAQAQAELVEKFPRMIGTLAGWGVTSHNYNHFVSWQHPTLPITVAAVPALCGDPSFAIAVGGVHDAVKVGVPADWQASEVENLLIAVIAAVIVNEQQSRETGRHGLVEVVETVENVSASWGPLLRYRSVCECGWKSDECYPKRGAESAHRDHVAERCGGR